MEYIFVFIEIETGEIVYQTNEWDDFCAELLFDDAICLESEYNFAHLGE